MSSVHIQDLAPSVVRKPFGSAGSLRNKRGGEAHAFRRSRGRNALVYNKDPTPIPPQSRSGRGDDGTLLDGRSETRGVQDRAVHGVGHAAGRRRTITPWLWKPAAGMSPMHPLISSDMNTSERALFRRVARLLPDYCEKLRSPYF